jgi:hypothetical protein
MDYSNIVLFVYDCFSRSYWTCENEFSILDDLNLDLVVVFYSVGEVGACFFLGWYVPSRKKHRET